MPTTRRRLGNKIRTRVVAIEEVRLSLQGLVLDLRETERRLALLEGGGAALDPDAPLESNEGLSVNFQAFMRVRSADQRVHARLYNVSRDVPIIESQISTSSTTSVLVTSGAFFLIAGDQYRAQFGTVDRELGLALGAHVVADV